VSSTRQLLKRPVHTDSHSRIKRGTTNNTNDMMNIVSTRMSKERERERDTHITPPPPLHNFEMATHVSPVLLCGQIPVTTAKHRMNRRLMSYLLGRTSLERDSAMLHENTCGAIDKMAPMWVKAILTLGPKWQASDASVTAWHITCKI
jgi:hypothetical protein